MKPLDYSKSENWILKKDNVPNADYDLIYFVGTSINNPGQENGVGTDLNEQKVAGTRNYNFVGSALDDNARVFVPAQRQMALYYALNFDDHDALLEQIYTKEPYQDLCAVLDYYFENYNKDGKKPYVLAGHSQGASSCQVLLEHYFTRADKKPYLQGLVAMYALGYGVSKKWFESLPLDGYIHFADGEGDYHSLISWNIEGPGEKGASTLLSKENDTLVINPLNWKRDETYAPKELNKGVYMDDGKPMLQASYFFSHDPEYLFDAQIDLKRGSVITTSTTNYIRFPGVGPIWGGKSLHSYDGRGYFFNLRDNVRLRVNNFIKDHK